MAQGTADKKEDEGILTEKKRRIISVLIIFLVVVGAVSGFHLAKERAKQSTIANAKGVLMDSAREQADTL